MKTVYILGAGFSFDAGAPLQKDIIREAFRLNRENQDNFNQEKFNEFKQFIIEQLNFTEEHSKNVDLEDIFTPLDRCLSENSQFRGINLSQIMKTRDSVFYVVGKTIQTLLNKTEKTKDYIDIFAHHLTKASSTRANEKYRDTDPVSIISTNWDILLDNSIYESIQTNDKYDGVVDYCCYISSKDEHDKSVIPGLEKLGQGGFNVKLLKLHGSLNWLQCPRCARLYAKFREKSAMHSFEESSSCRHCDKNFPEEHNRHILSPNMIMPTYLKDLSNPQYRIIWQNAGIEISEADRIVFIGYSLPHADFEMRQLLSRMTRKNAEIQVVDWISPGDDPKSDKRTEKENHWKNFFGKREIGFFFDGASKFIKDQYNC
ncbi:hypothetical protein KVG96_13255 [Pseudomonas sp. COR58]|uniref:Deacetylase sirtuin-type domain-containing protein n=1 Tax=Pseudomonas ekonensis TaxID=2842353 RepID=A0ABS6PEL9_9PSED|nr:hypothetical protein [Pseudomonas ekonensis]MBV4458923.1 hypothetical protein [Pseudomonas ekonensis]